MPRQQIFLLRFFQMEFPESRKSERRKSIPMIHAHAEAEKSIKNAAEGNKNRRLTVQGQIRSLARQATRKEEERYVRGI